MSVLSDLFSLEGLITLTVGSIISIRALRVTWIRNERNVSVQGNSNIVIINEAASKQEGKYKLLGNMIAAIIFFTYPALGSYWNGALSAISLLSIPFSLITIMYQSKIIGLKSLFSLFNILSSMCLLWIVHRSSTIPSFFL